MLIPKHAAALLKISEDDQDSMLKKKLDKKNILEYFDCINDTLSNKDELLY